MFSKPEKSAGSTISTANARPDLQSNHDERLAFDWIDYIAKTVLTESLQGDRILCLWCPREFPSPPSVNAVMRSAR